MFLLPSPYSFRAVGLYHLLPCLSESPAVIFPFLFFFPLIQTCNRPPFTSLRLTKKFVVYSPLPFLFPVLIEKYSQSFCPFFRSSPNPMLTPLKVDHSSTIASPSSLWDLTLPPNFSFHALQNMHRTHIFSLHFLMLVNQTVNPQHLS